jgi:alanine racemase
MAIPSAAENERTWAEIDPGALLHNLAFVRNRIGPCATILAVVKANAYGHGTGAVAQTLAPDTGIFGVANVAEAMEVEAAGTGRDIMLLSPCLPGERRDAVARNLIVTVSGYQEAAAFAAEGRTRVNFKVDTGMGRIGCAPDRAAEELAAIVAEPGIEVHSISSHLPSADEDPVFTTKQLEEFAALSRCLRAIAPGAAFHVLNSAGLLAQPAEAGDIVRPGLVLYGESPLAEFRTSLRPVLSWKARVLLVRELPTGSSIGYGRTHITTRPTKTAVIAAGYADGFPRQASGRGACVLLHGRRCPVLGRVTMDQIVVDAGDAGETAPGDIATLIGSDGDERITASDLAEQSDTIPWDILTGIGRRVARCHITAP